MSVSPRCAERHHLLCVDESCGCVCHVPDWLEPDEGDPLARADFFGRWDQ